MLQNVKVDVVYYKIPTDFEMEFNLGGCCRMRLLTDKVAEKKELVKGLAKAVSRSRVIIACGPLFAETGLIEVTAAAIGHSICRADNKLYKIKGDSEISIIEGSLPLVTSDGVFGGLIIESGPQTIILLTENKALRKQIMKELIHPYIEELCVGSYTPTVIPAAEIAGEQAPQMPEEAPQEAEIKDTTDEIPAEEESVEDICEDTETAAADEHNIVFEMSPQDDASAEPETELFKDEFIDSADDRQEPKKKKEKVKEKKTENRVEKPEAEKTDDFSVDLDVDFPEEPRRSRLNVPIIVLSILLVLVIAIIAYLIVFVPLSTGQEIPEYIRSLFEVTKV